MDKNANANIDRDACLFRRLLFLKVFFELVITWEKLSLKYSNDCKSSAIENVKNQAVLYASRLDNTLDSAKVPNCLFREWEDQMRFEIQGRNVVGKFFSAPNALLTAEQELGKEELLALITHNLENGFVLVVKELEKVYLKR